MLGVLVAVVRGTEGDDYLKRCLSPKQRVATPLAPAEATWLVSMTLEDKEAAGYIGPSAASTGENDDEEDGAAKIRAAIVAAATEHYREFVELLDGGGSTRARTMRGSERRRQLAMRWLLRDYSRMASHAAMGRTSMAAALYSLLRTKGIFMQSSLSSSMVHASLRRRMVDGCQNRPLLLRAIRVLQAGLRRRALAAYTRKSCQCYGKRPPLQQQDQRPPAPPPHDSQLCCRWR